MKGLIELLAGFMQALNPEEPLTPGLDPAFHEGPAHLYPTPPEGACPHCGAKNYQEVLEWPSYARCKACVKRYN